MDKPVTHTRIVVPHKDGYKVIRLSEVIYIESQDSICRIYKVSAEVYDILPMRINEIIDSLPIDSFCRIHRGYIVSLDNIVIINKQKTRVCVKGNNWLPVGRAYQPDLIEKFSFWK